MPDVAKALTDQVLRRVRDVHGIAHSRDLARTLLSHSQRLLNSLLGIVTTSTTFTTYPHQQFYQISGLLTGADAITKVMAVREVRETSPISPTSANLPISTRAGSARLARASMPGPSSAETC